MSVSLYARLESRCWSIPRGCCSPSRSASFLWIASSSRAKNDISSASSERNISTTNAVSGVGSSVHWADRNSAYPDLIQKVLSETKAPFAFLLDVQLFALNGNGFGLSGRQLVGANKVRKLFWIGLADGGIFIIAHCLTGRDLPRAVTSQPGVCAVIASSEFLAEDRFRLIEIVSQDRGLLVDYALHFGDLDRARITTWQRLDVCDQRGLVHGASFLIGKDAVIGEIFFPWF